jgi:predicted amidohydrolase YtcJ
VAAGVPFALGGDGPLDPHVNMMCPVTHAQHPSEALTREQAVAVYPTGSAHAEFAKYDEGRIAVGMLADRAVRIQDILTVDVDRVPATLSAARIVNGRVVRNTLQCWLRSRWRV